MAAFCLSRKVCFLGVTKTRLQNGKNCAEIGYVCNFFVKKRQKNDDVLNENLCIIGKVPIHMFGVLRILERIYNKSMGTQRKRGYLLCV